MFRKMADIKQIVVWGTALIIVIGLGYMFGTDTTLEDAIPVEEEAGKIFDDREIPDQINLDPVGEVVVSFDEIDDAQHVPGSPGQFVPDTHTNPPLEWVDIRKTEIWIADDWLWVKIDIVSPSPRLLLSSLPVPAEQQFMLTDEMLTWRIRINVDDDNRTDYTIDAVWNPTGQEGDSITGGYFRDVSDPEGIANYVLERNEFPGAIGTKESSLLTGIPLSFVDKLGSEFKIAICVNYTGDHIYQEGMLVQVYDCDPDTTILGFGWIEVKL